MKKYIVHLVIYVVFMLVLWVALNIYFGLNPWPEGYCEGPPDLCSWEYWKERMSNLPQIALLALLAYVIVVPAVLAIRRERCKNNEQKDEE